jgi:hypothetical protein
VPRPHCSNDVMSLSHADAICRTEALAKAQKIERLLGSSFTVSVSGAAVSAFPNSTLPTKERNYFDHRLQDVEAAVYSYAQLQATPAVDEQSAPAGKRVASNIESEKGIHAKRRKQN